MGIFAFPTSTACTCGCLTMGDSTHPKSLGSGGYKNSVRVPKNYKGTVSVWLIPSITPYYIHPQNEPFQFLKESQN